MTDANLDALEAEAAAIAAGNRPPLRQAIPIRIVENLQLAQVSPAAIRRTLQGEAKWLGPIVSIEWFLLDHDESAAIYAAKCPYECCGGKGDLLASTTIDRKGNAVLPFDSPGSLCCDTCDSEIEARYEREAYLLANPRRSPGLITADNPKACECGEPLPEGSPSQTKWCQPCATARARERMRVSKTASGPWSEGTSDHSAAS